MKNEKNILSWQQQSQLIQLAVLQDVLDNHTLKDNKKSDYDKEIKDYIKDIMDKDIKKDIKSLEKNIRGDLDAKRVHK